MLLKTGCSRRRHKDANALNYPYSMLSSIPGFPVPKDYLGLPPALCRNAMFAVSHFYLQAAA